MVGPARGPLVASLWEERLAPIQAGPSSRRGPFDELRAGIRSRNSGLREVYKQRFAGGGPLALDISIRSGLLYR